MTKLPQQRRGLFAFQRGKGTEDPDQVEAS